MKFLTLPSAVLAGTALLAGLQAESARASSHMDAPLITLDDAANTTDVYAFRSQSEDGSTQYLTTALAVYPFEEPGIGPNNYRFDDNVRYEIHVALGNDVGKGDATVSYQFEFKTEFQNRDTIRQAFLGEIGEIFDANQNLRQTYKVTKVDRRAGGSGNRRTRGRSSVLARDVRVPPNNQGLVTRFYNQDNNGENPAKGGVASEAGLDVYTAGAVTDIRDGHRVFAGQRDDGFYADIQSIFDLDFAFGGANKPFDSQGGFNVHMIVLNIPLSELGEEKIAGVYATTSRRKVSVNSDRRNQLTFGPFVQVARQGNPLFAEALVALRDKDFYNVTSPSRDTQVFRQYATNIELANLLGLTPVVDIPSIFIPDVIKVDLTTGPARLAGNPDFDRRSVFGGDTLVNAAGETVFGGWPNGRRFGDDVVDIALNAIGLDNPNVDGVTENDITFNDVFPYAATPLNGRSHGHHGEGNVTN